MAHLLCVLLHMVLQMKAQRIKSIYFKHKSGVYTTLCIIYTDSSTFQAMHVVEHFLGIISTFDFVKKCQVQSKQILSFGQKGNIHLLPHPVLSHVAL